MYHVVVRDSKGRALPSQITNYQHDHRGAQYDDLVFTYDFAAGEKRATFTVEAVATATPPDAPCVYARMVPERFDDIAWENDRIAHRMYGFALNSPAAGGERLRGSGIDVWAKRVSYPIVDRWYAKGHDQFHKDEEGEGLDLYSIGGSRGAGGTGIWDGTKLWTSDNFVDAPGAVERAAPRGIQAHLRALGCAARKARSPRPNNSRSIAAATSMRSRACSISRATKPWSASASANIRQCKVSPRPCSRVIPHGRWMSFWEENKDGGLGIAVILANDATPRGLCARGCARRQGQR